MNRRTAGGMQRVPSTTQSSNTDVERGTITQNRMRYLGTRLMLLVKVGAGVGMAILGFLMVTDHLSLRRVLAETGPEVVRLLVLRIHREIEHSGAQVVELAGALVGLVLIALTIRGYLRVTRGGQRA